MKKKLILPFILFVLLLSVAATSAADLNDTDNLDVLKDTSTDKSFTDFNLKVYVEDEDISLDSNYKYDNESDQDYVTGNYLYKNNFVINGNNHIIDCNNQARAFNITGKNVEINNLVIKNAAYESGSAIATNSKLVLNNVTFINCQGSGKESDNFGAIFSKGGDVNINNCKFIDTSGYEGASITAYSSEVTVLNSTFTSSSDKIVKGHIYSYNTNLTVTNSHFLNTTSKYAAAVFGEDLGIIDIENCTFKNLSANMTAGAIAIKLVPRLYVLGCEFDNVSSENNGGAIFADINGNLNKISGLVEIDGAKFTNCRSGFGGAILQLGGELYIYNSDFTSNMAEYEGGAIYTSFAKVAITNSTFTSNMALNQMSYGGACYFDMGKVEIEKCTFKNNLASDVTTIYAYDTTLNLENSYFNNPSNATSLYTVYGKVVKDAKTDFTSDNYSFGNTNYFYNFENTANPFTIVNGTLPFDELPEKFDLRDYGWVSPVKDQGFDGACWMFGNLAALESALMRYANVTYSLSVNNAQNSMVQYSKYGQIGVPEGGNDFGAVSY